MKNYTHTKKKTKRISKKKKISFDFFEYVWNLAIFTGIISKRKQ